MVLLDLNLPDSHGADTYRTVLKETPGVPIVVLSGLDDEELAVTAVHQGVQDYLVKGSFDSKQLARAMRYAIERQASADFSRYEPAPATPVQKRIPFPRLARAAYSPHLHPSVRHAHARRPGRSGGTRTARAPGNNIPQRESTPGHDHRPARSHARRVRKNICSSLNALSSAMSSARRLPCCRATAMNKHIGIEVGLDTRIPFVYADPNRAWQILSQSSRQMVKFTPNQTVQSW